jgi:hypothetical protein
VTLYDIPFILSQSLPDALTPKIIKSRFSLTGIWPFNSDLFTGVDFLPFALLVVRVKIISTKVRFLWSQPQIQALAVTLQHPAYIQDPHLLKEMNIS